MCMEDLNMLMVAIEVRREEDSEMYIAINPGPSIIIKTNTQGFFIAQSAEEIKVYALSL